MDKFEVRRLALKKLTDGFGKGGIAFVAKQIDKDASYVSRMLYAVGKDGKKRIGEDSVDVLNEKFPGWLDGQNVNVPSKPDESSELNKRRAIKQYEPLPEPLNEILKLAKAMNDTGQLVLLGRSQELVKQYPREPEKRKQQS